MGSFAWTAPVSTFNEMSVVIQVVEKPDAALVYWAMQMVFRQPDGSTRGQAHCGLQTGEIFDTTPGPGNATKTAINWGGYDDVAVSEGAPPGDARGFRGSFSALPQASVGPVTVLFEWFPDRPYLVKVKKSPKQNYIAAELSPGYLTGNQQAGEVAWRLTITDLTTGVETFIRDLLIPNCHTTEPMSGPQSWDEDFNKLPGDTIGTVPWMARFIEPRVDEQLCTQLVLTNTSDLLNTDLGIDKVGFWTRSVTTRASTNGQTLTHPGVVVRSTSAASRGSGAANTLVLAIPPGTATGERLLAFIQNHNSQSTPTMPAGWEQLFTHTVNPDNRITIFQWWHDGVATTVTVNNSASTTYLAGVMLAMFGSDPIAPPKLGTVGVSAANVTAWTAPGMASKGTNYGRVLTVVGNLPWFGGNPTTWPAGLMEVATSGDVSTTDTLISVGQEPLPGPIGSTPDRVGGWNSGTSWKALSLQLVVYPQLQRVFPTADDSNTGWGDAPLYPKVGETVPNTATMISAANGATCVMSLGASTVSPGTNEGRVLRYDFRRQDATAASFTIELLQGSTVIATKSQTALAGDTYVRGTLELTTVEAAAITDNGNLKVRIGPTVLS